MDLIERYLGAVRWNLPVGNATMPADDIIAELRDVIASRIEEREERLDRALTRDEISKLLQEFGHPLVVAAGYGKQQWLIGPDIFPFYLFSLKVVLAISVLVLIVEGVANSIFSHHAFRALAQGFDGAFWTLLSYAGLVTLIFAVLERTGWLSDHLARWKPEQLPDLSELRIKPKRFWERGFDVVGGTVLLLWWTGTIHFPTVWSHHQGIQIDPAPIWMQNYWPILALIAGRLLLSVIELLQPRWRAVQAVMGVALAIAGVVLLAAIYKAGEWVVITSTGMDAGQVADIARSLHLSLRIAIVVVGVIWVMQALGGLWRLYRGR
jgi:hypothetical protein